MVLVAILLSSVTEFLSNQIDKIKAYADRSYLNGPYFCAEDRREYQIAEYKRFVEFYDEKIKILSAQVPAWSLQQIAFDVYFTSYGANHYTVKDFGLSAKCLVTAFNIDPNSVARLSDRTKEVLLYDKEILNKRAPEFTEYVIHGSSDIESKLEKNAKGGCLIATATFGSEIAPQVQLLREIRDNTVLSTASGTSFMVAFNQFYYSFSPTVADWERQSPAFRELVKTTITPMLLTLSILNYVEINSEQEMLGYGIGVMLLNIGMYFVAPAFIIIRLKQHKK